MSNWPTRELQLKNYWEVKRLIALGLRLSQIHHRTGLSWTTIQRYRDSDVPPMPRGRNANKLPRGQRKASERGAIIRAFDVPEYIALLRDGSIKAFLEGDLDLHAKLTQELKQALVAHKTANKFFNSVSVDPGSVLIAPLADTLEAAE